MMKKDTVVYELLRFFDKGVEREFIYNTATGTRTWMDPYVDEEEDTIREVAHRMTCC